MSDDIAYVGALRPPFAEGGTRLKGPPVFVVVKKIAFYAFVGGFFGALIYGVGWLIDVGWLEDVGVGFAIFVALVGVFLGFAGKVAACPYCGERIGGGASESIALGEGPERVACPKCHELLVAENGALRAISPVEAGAAGAAPFEFACVRDGVWPDECISCGAPPTRYEEAKLQKVEYEKLLIGSVSVQSASVSNIPYCDRHGGEVSVTISDDVLRLVFPRLDMGRRYLAVNRGKKRITID